MGAPTSIVVPTRSGRRVDIMRPRVADISVADMTHHLGSIARWLGAPDPFYSVAEHSSIQAQRFCKLGRRDLARWALVHDGAEYLFGDVVAPLKQAIPWLDQVEFLIAARIFERLELAGEIPEEVRRADILIREDEKRQLFPAGTFETIGRGLDVEIERLSPVEARMQFADLGIYLFGDLWQ